MLNGNPPDFIPWALLAEKGGDTPTQDEVDGWVHRQGTREAEACFALGKRLRAAQAQLDSARKIKPMRGQPSTIRG